MKKSCPICGSKFKVFPCQKRTYCSVRCMKVGYADRFSGKNNPNFRHGNKQCVGCGKTLARNTKGERCVSCYSLAKNYKNPFDGKIHSESTRKLMVDHHWARTGWKGPFWGKKQSKKTRKAMGVARKRLWEEGTPEYRKKIIDALMRGVATQRSREYTKPEMVVATELDKMGIEFDHNAPLYGKFFVDFLLPDKTVIEVFGDYWHGNRTVFASLTRTQEKQKAKDRARVAYLTKCGHKVIVIWEKELKDNSQVVEHRLLKEISGFLEGSRNIEDGR